MQDGRLICKLTSEHELPMLAENENSYFFSNFHTHFRFLKGNSGNVEKVVIHEHDFELPKLK